MPTPCAPGAGGAGSFRAIPSLGPRRSASSTSITGNGTGVRSPATSSSSAPTRRRRSRSAPAPIRSRRRVRAAPCGSSTSTAAMASVPTLPRGTSTEPGFSAMFVAKISIVAFDALVAQVMAREPYRSAERVFWIVDGGTIHRGQRAADRLQARFDNLTLVHLPTHASGMNQIEIYFSILQRKALTPRPLLFPGRSRRSASSASSSTTSKSPRPSNGSSPAAISTASWPARPPPPIPHSAKPHENTSPNF